MKKIFFITMLAITAACSNPDDITNFNLDNLTEPKDIDQTIEDIQYFEVLAMFTKRSVLYDQSCFSNELISRGIELISDVNKCAFIDLTFSGSNYTLKNFTCREERFVTPETSTFVATENSISFTGNFQFFKRMMPDVINISNIRLVKSFQYMFAVEFDYTVKEHYKRFSGDTNTAIVIFIEKGKDLGFNPDFNSIYETFGYIGSGCVQGPIIDSDDVPWWQDGDPSNNPKPIDFF